ncbi:hypothetical protein FXO38_32288 [Capsicum annuum]|uniref:Retrovirus-related Pol polyprotein from transposon TNT 1-94 n=1 Tax=Capsicum annuum TaxID=4072 RepID=A0A2G2YR39_CAPAN|nr:hypothetical protein FXO38_32288 [Capsicum annuum]PHT72216.1 hypothetical protein T459_23001 [Capsicum annuum]
MDLLMFVCQFGKNKDRVIGYVDSNFAGDHAKRRSLSDYVFTIGGYDISWKATLQTMVAFCTAEEDYIAITEALKEAISLKGLFGELSKDLKTTMVFCDSQSAIFLRKIRCFTRGQSTSMFAEAIPYHLYDHGISATVETDSDHSFQKLQLYPIQLHNLKII